MCKLFIFWAKIIPQNNHTVLIVSFHVKNYLLSSNPQLCKNTVWFLSFEVGILHKLCFDNTSRWLSQIYYEKYSSCFQALRTLPSNNSSFHLWHWQQDLQLHLPLGLPQLHPSVYCSYNVPWILSLQKSVFCFLFFLFLSLSIVKVLPRNHYF